MKVGLRITANDLARRLGAMARDAAERRPAASQEATKETNSSETGQRRVER